MGQVLSFISDSVNVVGSGIEGIFTGDFTKANNAVDKMGQDMTNNIDPNDPLGSLLSNNPLTQITDFIHDCIKILTKMIEFLVDIFQILITMLSYGSTIIDVVVFSIPAVILLYVASQASSMIPN
jgi:hypothetical protein